MLWLDGAVAEARGIRWRRCSVLRRFQHGVSKSRRAGAEAGKEGAGDA